MRVFVTGATGYVGSAIVGHLIQAGHQVLGLARSEVGSVALLQLGAEVQGDLSDTEGLAAGAGQCDGVIHTATTMPSHSSRLPVKRTGAR
jgi:nucleoside-diphosphate-sugar epimerase